MGLRRRTGLDPGQARGHVHHSRPECFHHQPAFAETGQPIGPSHPSGPRL